MDAGQDEPGGHGHRLDPSLLPLKKRALNYDCSGGDPDPYPSSCSNKKKQRVVVGTTNKDDTGAPAPPPRQRCPVPAPAPAAPASRELPASAAIGASPPEPAAAESGLSDEEKKWLSKGKWAATTTTTEQDHQSRLKCPCPPVTKKLMHDGIRSSSSFAPHHSPSAVPSPSPELVLYAGLGLGEPLERRLASLRATRPWLVLRKTLRKSDVDENQNRLLISCKRGGRTGHGGGPYDSPLAGCFSALEMARIVEKDVGVYVTVLDASSSSYAMVCKFLGSNSGYRLIAGWKEFLRRHGMNLGAQRHRVWARDVDVEVWAFRSRSGELPFQPQVDATGKKVLMEIVVDGNTGRRVSVPLRIDHHLDPDGELGFILLLHENRNRRNVVKREEEEEDDVDWEGPSSSSLPVVARNGKKGKQRSGKRGTSSTKQGGSAPSAKQGTPAPAPVAEQGEAASLSAGLMFYAAVGLTKLQQAIWERWQKHVDGGGHDAKKEEKQDKGKG